MKQLHHHAEDYLDPDDPAPGQVRLDDAAENRAEDGSADGREHDERGGVLVLRAVRVKHICDEGKSYTPPRTGKTT